MRYFRLVVLRPLCLSNSKTTTCCRSATDSSSSSSPVGSSSHCALDQVRQSIVYGSCVVLTENRPARPLFSVDLHGVWIFSTNGRRADVVNRVEGVRTMALSTTTLPTVNPLRQFLWRGQHRNIAFVILAPCPLIVVTECQSDRGPEGPSDDSSSRWARGAAAHCWNCGQFCGTMSGYTLGVGSVLTGSTGLSRFSSAYSTHGICNETPDHRAPPFCSARIHASNAARVKATLRPMRKKGIGCDMRADARRRVSS
jgi:hypothetical protein